MNKLITYLNEAAKLNTNNLAFFTNPSGDVMGLYDPNKISQFMEDYDYDILEDAIKGVVEIRYNSKYGSNEIDKIYAERGYGPLMYMIAMQYSPEGLIPTRTSQITKEAKNVWKQFSKGVGKSYVSTEDIDEVRHTEDYLNKKYFLAKNINLSKAKNINSKFLRNDKYGEKYTAVEEAFDTILRQKMNDIYESSTSKLIGYKVMPTENGEIKSGANKRINTSNYKKGKTITMPGNGIYLSLDKDYVMDYYSMLADDEVLIKFEFSPNDITTGNIHDKETELGVKRAKIIDITPID